MCVCVWCVYVCVSIYVSVRVWGGYGGCGSGGSLLTKLVAFQFKGGEVIEILARTPVLGSRKYSILNMTFFSRKFTTIQANPATTAEELAGLPEALEKVINIV